MSKQVKNNIKQALIIFLLIVVICILKLNAQSNRVNNTQHKEQFDSTKQDRVKVENKNKQTDTTRHKNKYPHIKKETNSNK